MWDMTDVTPPCGYEAEMAKNGFKAKKGKQSQNSIPTAGQGCSGNISDKST